MRWAAEKKKLLVARRAGTHSLGNRGVTVSKEAERELKEIEKMLCINGAKSASVL
jgi:hypothetical protein